MCLALISFLQNPSWPVFVAANRDESYRRASSPPILEEHDSVQVLAPRDETAGGTWVGVNDRGLFALITNRGDVPQGPLGTPSRGLLVRDLLRSGDLVNALRTAEDARRVPRAPYNLVFGTHSRLFVWEQTGSPSRPRELEAGVHVVSNHGPPNDRAIGEVRRAFTFWNGHSDPDPLERGGSLLALNTEEAGDPPICKREKDRGTVSSTLISLGPSGLVKFHHADGPPDETPYQEIPFLQETRR